MAAIEPPAVTAASSAPRTRSASRADIYGITDLILLQSQAIAQLLSVEAAVQRHGTTAQDLNNAQQAVVEIAKLIAVALQTA